MEKDALYYYDLMYEIKKIARICYYVDDEAEKRIEMRKNTFEVMYIKGSGLLKHEFRMSVFQSDLIKIIREINSNRIRRLFNDPETQRITTLNNIENLQWYPNYVKDALDNCGVVPEELRPKVKQLVQQKTSNN